MTDQKQTSSLSIVGARFRPPARAILEAIPVGTPLILRAEPDNPADANAISVRIKIADLPASALAALDETLKWYDFKLPQLMAQSEWHVGYLPAGLAAALKSEGFPPTDVPGRFAVGPNGGPKVDFERPTS